MALGFQSLEFVLKLPIDVRVQLGGSGAVVLTAYHYRAFSALRTWGQVARNAAWGGFLPFSVVLEVRGLGYRVSAPSAQLLEFSLGFSHLVFFTLPGNLTARNLGNKSRAVQLSSVDWLLLTQAVVSIKRLKRVNVYKERGIFYRGEVCAGLKTSRRKKS